MAEVVSEKNDADVRANTERCRVVAVIPLGLVGVHVFSRPHIARFFRFV